MAVVEFSFAGLTLTTDDELLSPREWTAAQSCWGAELLSQLAPGAVLELCAGAGHIGLAAVHGTDRLLVAVEREEAATIRIRANAEALGMTDRLETRCCALEEALAEEERFALVIADPPWVPRAAIRQYPQDPPGAIDGGPDGLAVARECVDIIDRHLDDDGAALLQLGTRAQVTDLALPKTLAIHEVREYHRGVLVCLRPNRDDSGAAPSGWHLGGTGEVSHPAP